MPAWGNAGITYHGRLLRSDGVPVTEPVVEFKIQIRSPGAENCLLYQETHTRDMSGSQGVFSLTINDGTATTPNGEPFSLDRVFQNRGTFSFGSGKCEAGTTYTPSPADGRKLVVEFNDGTFTAGTYEQLPAQSINFVPAAIESMTVGGYGSGSMLRVHTVGGLPDSVPALTSTQYSTFLDLLTGTGSLYRPSSVAIPGADVSGNIPGNAAGFTGYLNGDVTGAQGVTSVVKIRGRDIDTTPPSDGQVLKWNGTLSRWEPSADTSGAGSVTGVTVDPPLTSSGGTIPNITISNASTSAVGVVRLATSSDTSAGLVVQANDSRLVNDRVPTGSAGGDLGGGYPGPEVVKLRGVAVAPTAPMAGQILALKDGEWTPTNFGVGELRTALGTLQFASASCSSAQTLTWSSLTDAFTCASITGLGAEAIASGTLDPARLGSGIANASTYLRGDGAWASMASAPWVASGNDVSYTAGNVGIGTASPARLLHVNGPIRIEGSALPSSPQAGDIAVDANDSNTLKYYDGSAWREAGGSGGGVQVSPAGMIGAFPTASCPAGWLAADGSAVSRTTFASLFAAIGAMYGAGDGSTTFNLPDYRGFFLRGWANGSAADPDRSSRTNRGDGTTGDNVGTKQADGLRSHSHAYTDYYNTSSYGGGYADWPASMGSGSSGRTSGATGGNETRPANISVIYCVSTATNSATTVASSGSGVPNKLAMWSSSTELADSPVGVNGGNVGIGTGTPQSALDVNGAVKVGNDSVCNASKAGSIRWTGSAFEGCNGTAWIGLSGGSAPAGTQCGKRYLYCNSGVPVYDTNGYSASSNSPCQGSSLTATCGVVGGYWTITSVGGCPSGYTGRHFYVGLDASQSWPAYHISCEKN